MKYKFLILLALFSLLNVHSIKSEGIREKLKNKQAWLGIGLAALFGGILYYWKSRLKGKLNAERLKKLAEEAQHLKTAIELDKKAAKIEDYNSKQDDEAIISIFQQNPSYLTDFATLNKEEATKQWKIEKTGGRIIKVIRINDKTVGFISYIINILGKGYIFHLGIEQDSKGKGYGKKLLDYSITNLLERSKLEKSIFDKDVKDDFYIETYINPSNKDAIEFFKKNNFFKKDDSESSYIYKQIQ